MIVARLGIAAAALTAVAALTAGARALMPQVPAARSQAARAKGEARPTPSPPVASIGKIRTFFAPGLIPDGLDGPALGPKNG